MVVQYILAVRKGKREMKDIQKLQTAASSEQTSEGQPEAEEVKSEEKAVDVEAVKEEEEVEDKPKTSENKVEDPDQVLPVDAVNQTEQGESQNKIVDVEEYYVKYRNFSYLHCEWKTEDELYKGDKRIAAKLKRFKQKMAHHANIFENVSMSIHLKYLLRFENRSLLKLEFQLFLLTVFR